MRRELQTNERHQVHIYLAQSQIGVCVAMQFSDVLERNTLLDVSHHNGFHYGFLCGHRVLITGGFLYGHRVLHGSGQRHRSMPPRLAKWSLKAATCDIKPPEPCDLPPCNLQPADFCLLPSKQETRDFEVAWSAYEEQGLSFEKYERQGLWSSDEDTYEELDERDGEAANNAAGMRRSRLWRRQQKKKANMRIKVTQRNLEKIERSPKTKWRKLVEMRNFKKKYKKAQIAEASKAGIAEAKEARITKGEIQTKEALLTQAKLKWRAELPHHLAMAAHVEKELFDSEDEEDLVGGLYTECGFDMHATYARLFFL